MLYLLLSKTKIRIPNISLKWAILGIFIIGLVYSFSIGGHIGFRSWTLTPLIDFENERLLLYFMTFLLGVLCFQQNMFAEKPKSKTLYNIVEYNSWIPVTLHIFARIWPFFYPEGFRDHAALSVYLAPQFLPFTALSDVRDDSFHSGFISIRLEKSGVR